MRRPPAAVEPTGLMRVPSPNGTVPVGSESNCRIEHTSRGRWRNAKSRCAIEGPRCTLIEVAADVTSLTCNHTPLDLIIDNRHFAAGTCDNPTL